LRIHVLKNRTRFRTRTRFLIVFICILDEAVESFATFIGLPDGCLTHLLLNNGHEAVWIVPHVAFGEVSTELGQSAFKVGALLDSCLSIAGRICRGFESHTMLVDVGFLFSFFTEIDDEWDRTGA
jgi:hypothetical protein